MSGPSPTIPPQLCSRWTQGTGRRQNPTRRLRRLPPRQRGGHIELSPLTTRSEREAALTLLPLDTPSLPAGRVPAGRVGFCVPPLVVRGCRLITPPRQRQGQRIQRF